MSMTDKKSKRPPVDSPEFDEWLMKQTNDAVNSIFGDNYKPLDMGEGEVEGATFGNIDNLDKTDAELYPDELEEYTPEERRKLFKLHKKDEGEKKDDDK